MNSKIVLITGGTTGIGFACADYLLGLDYRVIITGRTRENLDRAVAKLGINCIGILSDTSSLEDIDDLVAKVKNQFGKIDGLFVNAGIFKAASFQETTESLFDETMNVNFKGAFFTIQKFIPILNNPASVVLNTSIVVFRSFANTSIYTASKAALVEAQQQLQTIKEILSQAEEIQQHYRELEMLRDREEAQSQKFQTYQQAQTHKLHLQQLQNHQYQQAQIRVAQYDAQLTQLSEQEQDVVKTLAKRDKIVENLAALKQAKKQLRSLDKIEADISGFEGTAHLVFLGDYIDRGLQSRQVIEILLSDRLKPFEAYFLKGNHEDALLSFLSDPGFGPKWAAYGGRETLVSYGVRPPRSLSLNSEWEKAHDAFLKAIPNVHQKFLMTLPTSVRIGGYGFAHAGLRPGKTFAEQNDEDLMWIRDEFLGGKSTFDVMVVHGHTPVDQPHSDHRRINVDTGAYFTGRLTAAKLTGTTVEFIATDT